MELPNDEFAILQFYRTAKIQLGGLLPNIANLTLMSFTCHKNLAAVTQSTELIVQPQLEVSYLEDVHMDVKTEEELKPESVKLINIEFGKRGRGCQKEAQERKEVQGQSFLVI